MVALSAIIGFQVIFAAILAEGRTCGRAGDGEMERWEDGKMGR
jgi:hypothetical protein